MNWTNKQVLITGAGGFIGSHLSEKLVNLGANVTAFVHYNSRGDIGLLNFISKEILSNIKIVCGDMKDPCAIINLVKGKEIIFHLAALIGIPYSYVNPIDYVQTNVLGTSYLLNASLSEDIEKFIHTSTSEVYGTAQYVPIDEKHPIVGQSPYSASKIAADKMAESFHRTFNLPVSIIRPFNTYGPRQSARAVIPTIITQALLQNVVKLGSVKTIRDLTYIQDTVNGFIKIAEIEESVGEVINIGSSKEISIGDLAQKIFNFIDKNPKIETDEQRIRPHASEVERLMADTKKAKNILNWAPNISIDEGLKMTIAWISKNLNLYKTNLYNI